jgi:hypothetical protein
VSVDRAVPYLPFLDGPGGEFRWRLGVRPLDPADWIELGDDADDAIAEKQRLCRDHHETVFAALDDIEPEAHEVATADRKSFSMMRSGKARRRAIWRDKRGTCVLPDQTPEVERNPRRENEPES